LILDKPISIAVVNSKGGVGKSTLVINLAIAFSSCGYRVLIIDLDDQNSTLNWFNNKRENSSELISVTHLGPKHLKKQLSKLSINYDIVLVDGKGSRDKIEGDLISTTAISSTNFSIIPISPDELNKDATEEFIDDVLMPLSNYSDINVGLLISRAAKTLVSKAYIKYYRSSDFPCFKNMIPDLNIFKESLAQGKACFESNSANTGSVAFLEFFNELSKLIGVKIDKKRIYNKKEGYQRTRANKRKSRHRKEELEF